MQENKKVHFAPPPPDMKALVRERRPGLGGRIISAAREERISAALRSPWSRLGKTEIEVPEDAEQRELSTAMAIGNMPEVLCMWRRFVARGETPSYSSASKEVRIALLDALLSMAEAGSLADDKHTVDCLHLLIRAVFASKNVCCYDVGYITDVRTLPILLDAAARVQNDKFRLAGLACAELAAPFVRYIARVTREGVDRVGHGKCAEARKEAVQRVIDTMAGSYWSAIPGFRAAVRDAFLQAIPKKNFRDAEGFLSKDLRKKLDKGLLGNK